MEPSWIEGHSTRSTSWRFEYVCRATSISFPKCQHKFHRLLQSDWMICGGRMLFSSVGRRWSSWSHAGNQSHCSKLPFLEGKFLQWFVDGNSRSLMWQPTFWRPCDGYSVLIRRQLHRVSRFHAASLIVSSSYDGVLTRAENKNRIRQVVHFE